MEMTAIAVDATSRVRLVVWSLGKRGKTTGEVGLQHTRHSKRCSGEARQDITTSEHARFTLKAPKPWT